MTALVPWPMDTIEFPESRRRYELTVLIVLYCMEMYIMNFTVCGLLYMYCALLYVHKINR